MLSLCAGRHKVPVSAQQIMSNNRTAINTQMKNTENMMRIFLQQAESRNNMKNPGTNVIFTDYDMQSSLGKCDFNICLIEVPFINIVLKEGTFSTKPSVDCSMYRWIHQRKLPNYDKKCLLTLKKHICPEGSVVGSHSQ